MKNKLKSYKFWVGLIASIVVLITTLGTVLNFSVNIVAITSICATVLGILIALGVISKDDEKVNPSDDLKKQIDEAQSCADNISHDINDKIDDSKQTDKPNPNTKNE